MTTVFTIGYEGTDIDGFIAALQASAIDTLLDVRAVALSRKRGFSKKALAERCGAEGIEYLHLAELGDPKTGRDAARAGRYDEFRQIYCAHLADAASVAAVERLVELVSTGSACLMCFERDPLTCHRSLIGERLKWRGFSMTHLSGDSPSRYADAAKLPCRDLGQGAASSQQEAR